MQRRGQRQAGAEQEQADDGAALHGPQRVAVEVLLRHKEAEVVEVEGEVEARHPDDRHAAKRVQPVEARALVVQSVFS